MVLSFLCMQPLYAMGINNLRDARTSEVNELYFKKERFITQGKKKKKRRNANRYEQTTGPPNPPPLPPCWQQRGSRYNQIKGARQQDSHCSDCVYLH